MFTRAILDKSTDQVLRGPHIVHDLKKPLMKRAELRKHCGPYIAGVRYAGIDSGIVYFYLDSDFMPGLRWQWCDEVSGACISHTGWYEDLELQSDGDTWRGVVFRLPHNRGFLAGCALGEGMLGLLDTAAHSDEVTAAYAADSMAENEAEKQREFNNTED